MIEQLVAYDISELEKKKIISEAKSLHKIKLISDDELNHVRDNVQTELVSPGVFMRVLLFILTYIGMTTIIGPISLAIGVVGEGGYRAVSVIISVVLIWFTEKIMIQGKMHYKSGVTEAGIYTAAGFLSYGILGFKEDGILLYLIAGFVLCTAIAIRYLNLTAIVGCFAFFTGLLYQIIHSIGKTTELFMPMIFAGVFAGVFYLLQHTEQKTKSFVFADHFILSKTLSVLLIYLSVNYYVVRKLSESLMGLQFVKGQDIPFAIIFYLLTALIPIIYLAYGIRKRSVLFIRVGLLGIALSVATFKYYFSLGLPAITFTVAGVILIGVSVFFIHYLKTSRNGFTSLKIMTDKWISKDAVALLMSQTMGGNKMHDKEQHFGGGTSGGGGATSEW